MKISCFFQDFGVFLTNKTGTVQVGDPFQVQKEQSVQIVQRPIDIFQGPIIIHCRRVCLKGFVPLRLAAALSELKASEEPICRQNLEFSSFKRSRKVPKNPQRDPYLFMQGDTIVKIKSHLLSQKYRKESPLDSIFFQLETSENPSFEKKRYRIFFRKKVS